MNEVTRERIWRKLQVLPDAQLYEVLDYIEFIEHKYAPGRARKPDSIQRFAERLEDGMRLRSVAPKVISGTVGVIGTARRMFRSMTDAGRGFIEDVTAPGVERQVAGGAGARPSDSPSLAEAPLRNAGLPPQLPRRAGPDGAATQRDDPATEPGRVTKPGDADGAPGPAADPR